MMTGAGATPTRSSIFSAIHSGRDFRDGGGVTSASCSAPRQAAKLSRRSGRRSEAGHFMNAATNRWTIWPGCSTATSEVGSITTAATTSRLSTRPCDTSTSSWLGGRIGSSSPCGGTNGAPGNGSTASRDDSHAWLPIGARLRGGAGQWEADEARASRPVLRARGGEIPPRDSPEYLCSQPPRRRKGDGVGEPVSDQQAAAEGQRDEKRGGATGGAQIPGLQHLG